MRTATASRVWLVDDPDVHEFRRGGLRRVWVAGHPVSESPALVGPDPIRTSRGAGR